MRWIQDFSDSRLKSWCIHCRGWLSELNCNQDHAPSKSLLQNPRPENLPVVQVCKACNSSFSRDEAYVVAALSCALAGTTDPEKKVVPSAKRILAKSAALQAQIQRSSSFTTVAGEPTLIWNPDIERIKRVVVKSARGHAYYEFGEPCTEKPQSVLVAPLSVLTADEWAGFEDVSNSGVLPEIGSRMMHRVFSGKDLTEDGWVMVQEGVYRYAAIQRGRMMVRTVLYEYLATEVYWDYD